MKKESLWLDIDYRCYIKELDKDLDIDVLIIGGGITGLTTLYKLKDSDLRICLVDQDLVGHGVSAKTTGKINYLQETIYYDICKKDSLDTAKMYLKSQRCAIEEITNIIKREKIKCNLERVTSYVFTDRAKEVKKLKFEKRFLEKCGIKVNEDVGNIGNLKSIYSISVDDTYVFHPVKYLYHLKEICVKAHKDIYERTKIVNLKKVPNGYVAHTNKFRIKAKKVILACHYPFFLFPYFIPLKVGVEKSYITASLHPFEAKTFITSKLPTKSIRYHRDDKDYLIYLSNSSNICNHLDDKKNFRDVICEAKRLNLEIRYIWKNDDLRTIDKIPYIGMLEKGNDNLLIGTGYNTWGMTNGTLAGMILSDMILGHVNEYVSLCNPLRICKLSNIGGFITNMRSSAKGYIQNKLLKNKIWYTDDIEFKKIDGQNVAIYKEGKNTHIVYNKCPHMGCSLIFNEVEKTWDCPCHASRFNLDGKCIKGPSSYNIGYDR